MTSTHKLGASPGYAFAELERALLRSEAHDEPAVRERNAKRVEQWRRVLSGMMGGTLAVGSRLPVAGVPAWATLEVVHGGFATGGLLAGGPLLAHETDLLAAIGAPDGRAALNLHFVGDEGRARLLEMFRTGCFRVVVPEEGALLVVAWLIERGDVERAGEILDAITPFFDRLRFYPVPEPLALASSALVKLQSIAATIAQLERMQGNAEVERMNEALAVWAPLADRIVSLFLETVDGEPPMLLCAADGSFVRRPDGQPALQGGWPLRRIPAGFAASARALVDEYRALRARHPLCGKPERPKENLARLLAALERCADDPRSLGDREVGMLRRVLAAWVTRHGLPGSARHAAVRQAQARIAAAPSHRALRAVVIERLRARGATGGIDSVDDVLAPLSPAEADHARAPAGTSPPASLAVKVARCLEATVDELVERDVIGSSETLARVLPQLTWQIRSAGLDDPDLRRAYGAVYAAFRRRRSLLLLNLEHQVRLEELPWVAAMDAYRAPETMDGKGIARQALGDVVALAIRGFPQTILPNKLLQELRALAKAAEIEIPLTDELAADIFMGTFSGKFLEAAKIAARMLGGTLYERYYGAPFERVLAIDDIKQETPHAAPSSAGFGRLCHELAPSDGKWSVARNGKVIEQQQILTTHNLAVLFEALGLARSLRPSLRPLAERCFRWVADKQRMKHREWRSELRAIKDCAYAWRQMIFFLSLLDQDEVAAFAAWAAAEEVPEHLRPAVNGLLHVVGGGSFDAAGIASNGVRRFLGWSTERHFLRRVAMG